MAQPDYQLDLTDADILERIRRLELFSRFRVEGFLNGVNRSVFKGFSSDFLQHRQYFPGDNLRYLDWRVYGKSEKLFIREFEELSTARVSVIVDVSNSMGYRDESFSKHQFAIRCAALFFYLAFFHTDSASFTAFNTARTVTTPFGSSKKHLHRLLRMLVDTDVGGQTDFVHGLQESTASIRHKGLTIVLSDFMDEPEKIVRSIARLRFAGSDVIAMQIYDPSERQLNFNSLTRFHDMENNEIIVVDPLLIQNEYQQAFDNHMVAMKDCCRRHGFDYVALAVADDYDVPLMAYVRRRMELFT